MNNLGWELQLEDRLDEAIKVFRLNIRAYPDHYDPWDSYAEALLLRCNKGDLELAVNNFEKSLELNPDNENAARRLLVLRNYRKHEYLIPMRDGIRLYTQVYVPKDTTRTYPILFLREWYGTGNYGSGYKRMLHSNDLFVQEGFIFVHQDMRGRFMSEGEFEVLRPYRVGKKNVPDIDESTDAYDTVEWLLKELKHHNGRVGIWGGSYSGWAAMMAAIEPHPAVKAVSQGASPADWWLGDDCHHYGAFRLMYAYSWIGRDGWPRPEGPTKQQPSYPPYTTRDGYTFFLKLGSLSNVNKNYFHGENPTWNEYMEHGNYDEYWKQRNILPHLGNITVPVLNIAGWFDAEDYRGPLEIYKTIERNNPGIRNSIVIGPWRHGGWHGEGESIGDIHFGSRTGYYFMKEIEFPFFMHYLKDTCNLNIPEALVFQTGENEWRSYDEWPPGDAMGKRLFLNQNGTLTFSPHPHEGKSSYNEFISDPGQPVPWSTSVQTQQGHEWMVADQRFASERPDVLVYQSDILEEDITVAGPLIAHLSVSTSGSDADWVVKLIDVYPSEEKEPLGNYQMLLAGEVFRSKYRNSYENPEPMIPNMVTIIEFDMLDKFHTFKKGHRIMVQIQSSWFPVIDRNPQNFVNIYKANEEDFQKAIHRVYCSEGNQSFIKLIVLNPK
ncbi:MAG: CocE/NonD family hydrolase [Bacteroidales bacterium]|nr:MAG: CocE/NonD family hydrolase [Bacteroidales bacterium]